MSTTLVLAFPWGRYHANPWGRHVNEGEVELPPSPWRLLRALYATWKTRVPDLGEAVVHGLLAELATPPVFFVPRHEIAHTRHYYPDSVHRTGKASTDRTLDAFAAFERGGELAVRWPGELDADQHAALEKLAAALPYFGRADSLCEAAVPHDWQPTIAHEVWSPVDVAESVPAAAEVTTLLGPELPLNIEALVARPTDVRRRGLLFPVGTRFVGYQRTRTSVPAKRRRVPRRGRPVTAVRFSVLQPALPPETDALIYTDLLRQAALSKLGGERARREATVLGGKTADMQAATEQHRHAHYLPLIVAHRLTGLLVWAPGELPEDELAALTQLRQLRSRQRDAWKLEVRVSGIGEVGNLAPELTATSRPTAAWRSALPFTPPRYPKRSADWQAFLAAEIAREARFRGLPEPTVEPTDGDWVAYRRYRPSARMRRDPRQGQATCGSAFLRLQFPTGVTGPVALGHLSHFGLGLFRPER